MYLFVLPVYLCLYVCLAVLFFLRTVNLQLNTKLFIPLPAQHFQIAELQQVFNNLFTRRQRCNNTNCLLMKCRMVNSTTRALTHVIVNQTMLLAAHRCSTVIITIRHQQLYASPSLLFITKNRSEPTPWNVCFGSDLPLFNRLLTLKYKVAFTKKLQTQVRCNFYFL